jgi:hypothetical protein
VDYKGGGCTAPDAVTRNDLMAYVDGDVSSEVAGHIQSCSACRAEAHTLARSQQTLRAALDRFECPAPHTLGEYALSVLAPPEQRLVAAHIADCPRCSEEIQTLRSFLSAEPVQSPGVVERLRQVLATLVTPVGVSAFAGLRGRDDALTEARIYRADALTFALVVQPDDPQDGIQRWALDGLITREDAGATRVAETRLVAANGTVRAARADELGNLVYEALPSGTYRLELDLPEQTVVIEELWIGGE